MLRLNLGRRETKDGPGTRIERSGVVLAALAAGDAGTRYDPIRIQNLLFLVDREIADDIGGPHFDFRPHHAGPHDPGLFRVVESLEAAGKVVVDRTGPYWTLTASKAGYLEGRGALEGMGGPARRYLSKASRWILAQPFWAMMSGIYRKYPDIAVNNRIPQSALQDPGWRRRMHPFLAGIVSLAGVFRGPGGRRRGPAGDAAVLESDWRAVGDDIRFAIEQFHASVRA